MSTGRYATSHSLHATMRKLAFKGYLLNDLNREQWCLHLTLLGIPFDKRATKVAMYKLYRAHLAKA